MEHILDLKTFDFQKDSQNLYRWILSISGLFKMAAKNSETIVYEKDKEAKTRWGHWIVCAEPVKNKDGTVIRCEKIITVNPGASLSSQNHFGRGETYKRVSGTTHVFVNGKIITLEKAGDEVVIPRGSIHFSWNEGSEPSVFHEIQKGPLCDEADIMRNADKYKRFWELNRTTDIVDLMMRVAGDRIVAEGIRDDYHANDFMQEVVSIMRKNDNNLFGSKCSTDVKSYFRDLIKMSTKQHGERTPDLMKSTMKKAPLCA